MCAVISIIGGEKFEIKRKFSSGKFYLTSFPFCRDVRNNLQKIQRAKIFELQIGYQKRRKHKLDNGVQIRNRYFYS
jgi:hypothetical protein